MPESVDRFLSELNNRYQVDERFKRNIRPLVESIFVQSISSEERARLLNLVEQTFKRQVENRENLERAKDGIRRIFSNLYKKILKDMGPQGKEAKDGKQDQPGARPGPGEDETTSPRPGLEGDRNEDPGKEEGSKPDGLKIWKPEFMKPLDPVWSDSGKVDNPPQESEAEGEPLPSKKDLLFGEFLLRHGALDRSALLGALEEQVREKPLIGWVGLRRGALTEDQILRVLTRQIQEDRRFGEIAVEEGYLDLHKLDELRRVQKKYTPLLGRILVSRGDLTVDALKFYLDDFAAEFGDN